MLKTAHPDQSWMKSLSLCARWPVGGCPHLPRVHVEHAQNRLWIINVDLKLLVLSAPPVPNASSNAGVPLTSTPDGWPVRQQQQRWSHEAWQIATFLNQHLRRWRPIIMGLLPLNMQILFVCRKSATVCTMPSSRACIWSTVARPPVSLLLLLLHHAFTATQSSSPPPSSSLL